VTRLVLDSGAVTRLADRSPDIVALIRILQRDGLWPPVVPSVVLVESLTGQPRTDVLVNRLLKICDLSVTLPEPLVRRAASLRALARRGSAIDAIVVATAEPGGSVLSADLRDLRALAAHADDVTIQRV
jgi:hypothetical protein